MTNEHEPEAGFSNSEPVEAAPQDVRPDVQVPDPVEPGFSNSMTVQADEPEPDTESDDDKAKKAPAQKSAAKSAAKKKG